MQHALRPYVTAGIALVGSSLISVTPAVAPMPGIATIRDVALTGAMEDFLAPWIEQYNTAAANATTLFNNFALAPFVGYQQDLANQGDFWSAILADPSSIPEQVAQLQEHMKASADAYSLINAGGPTGLAGGDPFTDLVVAHTLSGEADLDLSGDNISVLGHQFLLAFLPSILPPDLDRDLVLPILNFLSSPLSGILIGSIGPWLSPGVALLNSIQDGDGLNEIMANMVGAYFNGATLNLDFLIPLVESTGLLPEGTNVYHIDLALGGLLTPGVVGSAPNLVPGTGEEIAAPGGSIFNSLGLNIDASLLGAVLPAVTPAHAVGPIGAWEGWMQALGVVLGSGWSGKANPQDAVAPLTGFQLPQIPADIFGLDDGGVGAGDATDVFADLAGLIGFDA
ncbi:outer membrane porin GjpA [[Mycobacterium] kokjensenii]|uniref:Outer membrane porin GjpA n=1 Tax=[Mycobacterium] kokjensenii TaxID=3064287 RepID=A0ABM9LPY7_9MYCO|nr:outer membrane porin GjpA [Mycolicibacter sp. MU0083]CAJ1502743.1 outer membrane porin GjpA [Mycolicibacter sp. MU0083]